MHTPVPYGTATTQINTGRSVADFPDNRTIFIFYPIVHTILPLLKFCRTDTKAFYGILSKNLSE